ncbi:hypothetical protein [Usitatibacter palustris]|uniref:Uncharacterized protein n=1 Tax=Usitatibacter palustris TaxID=2732487 RepID=A0A6M4H1K2_9PROT|nr:hypothetical protein [Usitatibacter palustris]QJR13369.1 hypothetical protein DSM104440_00152 [Usitatibacter palustris]
MYTHEAALILVVAIPVLAIAGMNLALMIGGERGTLLMPTNTEFEAHECPALVVGAMAKARAISMPAANDVEIQEVA